MDSPTAKELIKVPPDQRDNMYLYPYTGPYEGEPGLYEVMHLEEFREIWGEDHLTIHKTCPTCNSTEAEWIRNEWAICFNCLTVFEVVHYEPLPYYLEYEED